MEKEGYSIKEAAEMTGYQNLNNYYKYFKVYMGMTPAQYVKQRGIAEETEVQGVAEKSQSEED